MEKRIYSFNEGKKEMKELLGGKGANLAEMTRIGIPVPQGFTIITKVCQEYYENKKDFPKDLMKEVKENLKKLEKEMKMELGGENPLLLAVRSGAVVSMPGMMDTILNLGLNDTTVLSLVKKTKNERFAYDSYRRFIQMFGNVVLGINHSNFEKILETKKETLSIDYDTQLTIENLKQIIKEYKEMIKKLTNHKFPEDPLEQLELSIKAVFESWNNERAKLYRKLNNLTGLKGTAVNIQAMVFGNMGETSGTGVCFTRNPSTGEKKFYGEFLINAQGEDVVAGIRTPQDIESLKEKMPKIYNELEKIYKKLELHYRDMQDMEFTIQESKLYILQTRNGKRTAHAAVKIATDMVGEKLITKHEAILRIQPEHVDKLLHKQLDPIAKGKTELLGKGLPASPGAAVGQIIFNAEKADKEHKDGKKIILVRMETSPEDLIGMNAAEGILTSRGGMTSHAAVVARGMGKCCISGCQDAKINEEEKTLIIHNQTFKEFDYISLDGNTGEILKGQIPTTDPELSGSFGKLMQWADEVRKLKVRANADSPGDARRARKFGAEGIGLCRTEHMFFEGERIKAVRKMILSSTREERKKALNKLLPMQQKDFEGLFKEMEGLPVTIRLLDPPLHEFLPRLEEEIKELAKEMNLPIGILKQKIQELHEQNPMLGYRGCRLAITYPEIAEMQVEAIIKAALKIQAKGKKVMPEIMIPLIGKNEEFTYLKEIINQKIKVLFEKEKRSIAYKVGTMIEVPRGALTADEIAKEAEFFSFGTNDLTQMTFGYSRDDAGVFIKDYLEKNILEKDPFITLDQSGVGQLIKIAVEKGKQARKNIKLGVCGEHGGDPESIQFCHIIGLDYVSCSPFRIPIARLVAAQSALNKE